MEQNEGSIQEFDFMDHHIEAVWNETLGWMFSPKRFCENIGISWGSQYNKIKKNKEKFSYLHMKITGSDGKTYDMLLIPANRIDTWLLSINANKIKDEFKKKVLVNYQSKLSDWLHTRHFLTPEEEKIITDVAYGREQLRFKEMKDIVLTLPDELAGYKQDRLRLITDVQLGIVHPSALGVYTPIDKDNFCLRWETEGWIAEKFLVVYYQDFKTTREVEEYAKRLGLASREIYIPTISESEGRIMTKEFSRLGQSIGNLVVKYNQPGADIRKAIYNTTMTLVQLFGILAKGAPPTPQTISAFSLGQRLAEYRNNPEYCWWPKRNGFFEVFDCCVDCWQETRGQEGYEIVSKNFNVHHRHYATIGREHPSDLVPLCWEHHEIRERKQER